MQLAGHHTHVETMYIGAPGRTRTDTPLRIQDFESSASTNSTTGALCLAGRILAANGVASRPVLCPSAISLVGQ